MGRKKSPVTRNKSIGRRYVDPAASGSSLSTSEILDLLGNVSPPSLRGLAAIKQEATAMDTESSSDSLQLPGPPFQSLRSALPIGGDTRERRQNNRRKRRSSGDDVAVSRRDEAGDSSEEREEEAEEEEEEMEMVTISVSELEKWQQRVIFHVEDHFMNEQLKRIAEFGRVHGSIVQEAKQYVSNMEMQLQNQLEEERAALRAQAEEFVTKTATENESLRQQVEDLAQQVEGLEKQVDTLEQQMDTLKLEKAKSHQEQNEGQHENREQVQQTHSPSNHRTQVQPGKGKTNGKIDNRPSNEKNHDANGYGLGCRGSCSLPQTTKQINGGLIDHCCSSQPTDATPDHSVRTEVDQLLQQQQLQAPYSNAPPGNNAPSAQDGLQ